MSYGEFQRYELKCPHPECPDLFVFKGTGNDPERMRRRLCEVVIDHIKEAHPAPETQTA